MPRALIAALLLTGCSGTEIAELGSDEIRDAGVVREAGPLEIACDARSILEDFRQKVESGELPKSCSVAPLIDPECPIPFLYRRASKCFSDIAGLLPTSLDNLRDD